MWGGSSSVGCSAIQLAKAAGYHVITVAGKRNHELCAELGADMTFDHAQPGVVEQIVQALAERQVVGAFDCIGDQATTKQCAAILAQSQARKILVSVLDPPKEGLPEGVQAVRCKCLDMLMSLTKHDDRYYPEYAWN